jgi:phosphoribosylaminoimidazole-succinocarboxamide synthase
MTNIEKTNFTLPGQKGELYRGKVGDVYTVDHEGEDLLVLVRTDRISAFDRVLSQNIPFKGQVLNQISAELLAATRGTAPNWFITSPDPNVSIGRKATPFKLEVIVRSALLGSSWAAYKEGMRELGGVSLGDDMNEFQSFDTPLVTPTTKAEVGHDESISPKEIVEQDLATESEYSHMSHLALDLFAKGQAMAQEKGLLLADTKYEFGRLSNEEIVLIDEVHTPDSSRYFPTSEYEAYVQGNTHRRPEQMSKEFVREWLTAQGFNGHPGQQVPDMSPKFVHQVSKRYIELYERVVGKKFEPAVAPTEKQRLNDIERSIIYAIKKIDFTSN